MNKSLVCLVFILGIANTSLVAQKIELTPFSGYTFNSSFDIRGGKANLSDGISNGLIIGINLSENIDFEMLYNRHETRASAYSYLLDNRPNSEAVATYALIGLNRIGVITPDLLSYFGGLKVGVAALTSKENKFDDVIKFGLSFGGGIKYHLSDRLGVRLGANLYMPVVGAGAGLWFSGNGASASVSTYSPLVQFNLQGGLIIKF